VVDRNAGWTTKWHRVWRTIRKIQAIVKSQNGSFEFSAEPISEIGDQSGGIGKFTIDAEPGDYELHFWMPLTEPSNEGGSCNFIASFSIEQIFE